VNEAGTWERLSAALERVVEAPEASRPAVLAEVCGGDDAFRREVEHLVAAYRTAGDRFAQPAAHRLAGESGSLTAPAAEPGHLIGPYRIVREIGRGGMGTVYEAFRADDDFRKRVALKTLALGRGHEGMRNRFRRERRILARLDHRNIAALLDGGLLPDGVPWFAMEYVEGLPIDRCCVDRALPLADRVRLVRQACGAVHFAHQNLVVHRDLKPGNVLVTADGTVKLLDFGIAKLLAADDDASDPDLTGAGVGPYTPAYASPEQLRGAAITTASDVHALGVILFQVLTDRHPFRDDCPSEAELRRRIEHEPPPVTGLGPDLDAIVGKALHKEPGRRYDSAEQLSDDLGRWLAGQPIRARPDTLGYRIGKLVRRNRMAAVATAVALGALVALVVVSRHQARVAAAERDRARVEAAKAARVTAFVQEMLRSADPREARPDLTVADALAGATARADSTLSADPLVAAAVFSAIGRSYLGLGRYRNAEAALRRALALREASSESSPAEVAASRHQLGLVLLEEGELAPAESLFRSSLAAFRALEPPDSAGLARVLNDVGDLLQYAGRLTDAEASHREALALRAAVEGPRGEGVAASLNNIAVILGQQGRWAAAESLGRAALGIVTERLGPRHPDVASGLNALAFAVQSQRRLAEAESLYRAALDVRMATLGPDHPETARTYMNLGWLLYDARRYPDALVEADRVLRLRGRVLPDDHPAVGSTLMLRGQTLLELDSAQAAETSFRAALAIRERALPRPHWLIAASQSALAEALTVRGRFMEAESLLAAALPVLRSERGEEHDLTVLARQRQARLAAARGRSP
jgi:serine/threonine-protein kinase